MVAINKILLPECTGEGCGGETGTCTDSRVHRRSAENRVPATRNHRRGVAPGPPALPRPDRVSRRDRRASNKRYQGICRRF